MELKPLDQQVIVITDASGGVGQATAAAAALQGAKLVLAASSEKSLNEIVQRSQAAGGAAIPVVADGGDREQMEWIAETAIRLYGRIDIWINTVGVSVHDALPRNARRLPETHFWGVVHGSLVALPHLQKTGGALINVGSESSEAWVRLQGQGRYTERQAVQSFTEALRVEAELEEERPISVQLVQPATAAILAAATSAKPVEA